MVKPQIYRVRIYRKIEDWIAVKAETPLQAEQLAATLPNVIFVFGRSAMRGDRPVEQPLLAAIEDEGDE